MSDAAELYRLSKMPWKELQGLWAKHFNRRPPSQRNLIVREIAWRIQEQQHGGFDARTRQLLQAAMRSGFSTDQQPLHDEHPNNDSAPPSTTRARPRRSSSPKLPAAAKLVRAWGGAQHEVTVLEHGRAYRYNGQTYKSLTEIARVITGAHWSGPRFFGLAKRTQSDATPSARTRKGTS